MSVSLSMQGYTRSLPQPCKALRMAKEIFMTGGDGGDDNNTDNDHGSSRA